MEHTGELLRMVALDEGPLLYESREDGRGQRGNVFFSCYRTEQAILRAINSKAEGTSKKNEPVCILRHFHSGHLARVESLFMFF